MSGMRPSAALVLAGLCVACLWSAPGQAQMAEGQSFGDWVVRCATPPGATRHECVLQQTVFTKEPRRQLLNIAIGFFGKERVPGAIFAAPLRVYLPAGLILSIPGATVVRIAFDVCVPQGCRAPVSLTQELVAAMKKAERGEVTVEDAARKPHKLPISLKGFTAGYNALSRK